MTDPINKPQDLPIAAGAAEIQVVLIHNNGKRDLVCVVERTIAIRKRRPCCRYDGKMRRVTRDKYGRKQIVLRQKTQANDATIDGTRPQRGAFFKNTDTGKMYGPILSVRRNGDVVWLGMHGAHVTTRSVDLIDGPYAYVNIQKEETRR